MSAAAVCALLVAAACGNPPARSSVPAPADWAQSAESDPPLGGASLTTAPQTPEAAPTAEGSGTLQGLIAAAGPTGLRMLRPDGVVVAELVPDQIVTQPTWSRDGRRLAATLIDPSTGTAQVAVIDAATFQVDPVTARRPYFFYTWSYDGSRLAALGPGSSGGTAVDILDDTGVPSSTVSLQGLSMYVAWEPGGSRLLLHAGPQLLLIADPDSPGDPVDFGVVGSDFQAPAWVPGTHDFLYVDSGEQAAGDSPQEEPAGNDADGPQLLRRGADSGEITSLGPVGGFTLMAVHPNGDVAALSLPPVQPSLPDPVDGLETASLSPSGDLSQSASLSQTGDLSQSASLSQTDAVRGGVQGFSGSVEIVDLVTGERLTVLDQQGFWLEWSPDGSRLLIAALARGGQGGLAWHVWDGAASDALATFTPSEAFARNYLPFADQYAETPRLWSPDSAAIVFGARTASGGATTVARLDDVGRLRSLGPADIAFWSPAPESISSPEPE